MGRYQVTSLTIAVSAQVSDIFGMSGAVHAGLWFPVVTSATFFIQCAPSDATSANFVRAQNALGSGDFTMAVGPGSNYFVVPDAVLEAPFARLFSNVAQSAARNPVLVVKL